MYNILLQIKMPSFLTKCKSMAASRQFSSLMKTSQLSRAHFDVSYLYLPSRNCFFERNTRGSRYPVYIDKPFMELVKLGRKIFFEECKLFTQEVKEKFQQDSKFYVHGESDVFYRFDSKESLQKWRVSSDKTHNEGFSECSLTINDKGKGVFSGVIDTTPPKDGAINYTGYCGMKSLKLQKSFFRSHSHDWIIFTHLELRVKGDGRTYAIHLGTNSYYDATWFNYYTYFIFTRGGPYWQTIRIPFSKFFLTNKGRIHGSQAPLHRGTVDCIAIMCANVPGPFRLEIDYIGCHVDMNYKEDFAYESYIIPKEYIAGA